MELQVNGHEIQLVVGDITRQEVDVIVNAANSGLLGGGGVDGAIHKAAGPELLKACQEIGGCPTGEGRITPGFNLNADWVVHAVGPVYRGGQNDEQTDLWNAYWNSLILADLKKASVVAFPAISTGIYGYPLEEAATVALSAAIEYLKNALEVEINIVRFVLFDQPTYDVFAQILNMIEGGRLNE